LTRADAQRRIFGVDFSGAADAGRKIWIAEGRTGASGLRILECRPAAELPGGAVERPAALDALRRFIAATPDAIFGCDFPFSLPRRLIQAPRWFDFIRDFLHADAPSFRAHCRSICAGREPKRDTDLAARTPWCAFNLRLHHQSFHGMANLLRPLVLLSAAVVLPMQEADPALPWIVEVCPASTLGHLQCRWSYKGRGLTDMRRRILARLVELRLLHPLPDAIEARLLANNGGDALDSIIAAVATRQALREILTGRGGGDPLEGRVYFHPIDLHSSAD